MSDGRPRPTILNEKLKQRRGDKPGVVGYTAAIQFHFAFSPSVKHVQTRLSKRIIDKGFWMFLVD